MPDDIGSTERMIDEWQEHASERASRFQSMREQVEQITVTESSRDGSVTVTVGSNGILSDLDISESASSRPMSQVSAEIMRTLQKARARIPDLMQEAVAETAGTEDSAAQHVLSEARRNFPEPPEDEEEPRRGDRQEIDVTPQDDFDDDFGGESFLR